MNKPLRRVAVAIFVLFALMLGNLTRLQFFQAKDLASDEHNRRLLQDSYAVPRGAISTGGLALATSKETNGELKYQRVYQSADKAMEYSPITGYTSKVYGNSGVELYENSILDGTSDVLAAHQLSNLITGKKNDGGNVILTVNPKAQDAAWQGLSGMTGAAIALDPKTGKILAMASSPSFDPNGLASHDDATVKQTWSQLNPNSPSGPMSNRALGDGGPWPPGSTMKVIVSAAALNNGYSPDTQIPAGSSWAPSDAPNNPIHNDVPQICPQDQVSLLTALQDSCNTGFAQLGVKLGSDTVVKQAEAFGLNKKLQVSMLGQDKGRTVPASQTGNPQGQSQLGQTSIGQFNAAETPLQEAMIASAVANNGTEMQPYLVQEIQSSDLTSLRTADASTFGQPISSGTSDKLRQMMDAVVQKGTGTKAQIDGYEVGGKTGTAEHGAGAEEHGWFMGYARDKNGDPKVAVAVFLQGAGENGSGQATGIAGNIMKAVLGQ